MKPTKEWQRIYLCMPSRVVEGKKTSKRGKRAKVAEPEAPSQ